MHLTFLFLMVFSFSAKAQTILNWGISTELPYFQKAAKEFKEIVENKTKGRVKVNIELYDDLANEKGTHEFLKTGKFQIHQQLSGNFEAMVPRLKIWNIPFLFKNDNHVEKYLHSKKAQSILDQLQTDEILPVEYTFSGGFLYVYGPEKINSFTDLVGKKFSIMYDFGVIKDFFAPLKIQTELKNYLVKNDHYNEVLGSDAADLIALLDMRKIQMTVTNHRIISRILSISKKSLAQIDPKDRQIVLAELKKAAVKERQLTYKGKSLSLELLKNRGYDIHEWSQKNIAAERELFNNGFLRYKEEFRDEIEFIQRL